MKVAVLVLLGALAAAPASAQRTGTTAASPGQAPASTHPPAPGEDRVRARFRTGARASGTTVDQSQAEALTLTLSAVGPRPVQTWIRTAGVIDSAGRTLQAEVSGVDAILIKAGQRVRAFPPSSKSSMYQAFVTQVAPHGDGVVVQAALASPGRPRTRLYVMEIVVEQGPFLSVPNEAIIEEGEKQIVYVQQQQGQFTPREIRTGIQGELYTQVLGGVNEGEQVVTFGSFFIDAEEKLKGTTQAAQPQERR
jgi:hypothetical protein